MAAKIPSIESPQDTGALGWLRSWLDNMRTWARTRDPSESTVGDPLDKFVPRRELLDAGLYRRTSDGGFAVGSAIGGSTTTIINPDTDPPDLTPPPTPTGLAVQAGISNLLITWDAPTYTVGHGNAYTIIYGAIWLDGDDAPTFGDPRTKLIDTASQQTSIHAYPTEPNTRWCIWLKFKSVDGVESASPAGGINGFQARTGQDVSALLDVLAGKIRSSHLYSELGTRIDLIDATETVAGSVASRVKAERDLRIAADADILQGANSYTDTNAYTKANGEQVATDLTTLRSQVNSDITGLPATRALLLNDYATIAGPTNSLASVTTSLQTYATDVAGTAQSNAQNYTEDYSYSKDNGEALSGSLNTLVAKVTTPSATPGAPNYNVTYAALQNTQSTLATLDGRASIAYTVRTTISAGGRTLLGGFGLMGDSDSTPGSEIEFGVLANRFWVGAPTGSGVGDTQLFTLQTTTWDDNGVSRPAGAFIDAAFIKNLTAIYATIANLVADDITSARINVAQLESGSLDVGSYAQSAGYTGSGTNEWRIDGNGTARFTGVYVSGTVYAISGAVGGNIIDATGIQSPGYTAGSTGYRFDSSGVLRAFAGGGDRVLDMAATGLQSVLKISSSLDLRANGEAYFGALSVADTGGHVRGGQPAYNTGAGFWIGIDGGTPKMSIGNASGPNLRWTGTELLISGQTFDLFSASITGGDMMVSVGHGFNVYGSRDVSITGGRPPFKYVWQVTTGISYVGSAPYRLSNIASYGGSTESSVTLCGASDLGQGQTLRARVTCHVADSNGRSTLASFLLTALHAPEAGGQGGGGGESGSDP